MSQLRADIEIRHSCKGRLCLIAQIGDRKIYESIKVVKSASKTKDKEKAGKISGGTRTVYGPKEKKVGNVRSR